jgi:hypothetical protein
VQGARGVRRDDGVLCCVDDCPVFRVASLAQQAFPLYGHGDIADLDQAVADVVRREGSDYHIVQQWPSIRQIERHEFGVQRMGKDAGSPGLDCVVDGFAEARVEQRREKFPNGSADQRRLRNVGRSLHPSVPDLDAMFVIEDDDARIEHVQDSVADLGQIQGRVHSWPLNPFRYSRISTLIAASEGISMSRAI